MKQMKQTIFLCLLWMIGMGVHAEEIPNNEIWYISYDGEVVEPTISYFGIANIISNSYKEGKGIITFDCNVTNIKKNSFFECYDLASIIIPNSVTIIEDNAFYRCSSLISITFGNSVTSIGNSAFERCISLTSITLPNSVTSIGNSAFWGCKSLTSIDIPNSVTSIGSSAFENCIGLTSIDIPNSVTSIGEYAFDGCNKVETLIWGSNLSPHYITQYCNAKLKKVVLEENITSIGGSAFEDCKSLTSVTIPNSVISIGRNAFRNCTGLTSITIPNSVTSIGDEAFWGCNEFKSVEIPNSVSFIGRNAFNCSNVESIIIGDGIKDISSSFTWNIFDELSVIVIGKSILSLPNLSKCPLNYIIVHSTIPPTAISFDNYQAAVYIPYGYISAYTAAPLWNKFKTIHEYDYINTNTQLIINQTNGEFDTFMFSDSPKITHNENNLILETNKIIVEYPIDKIDNFAIRFINATSIDGLKMQTASSNFIFVYSLSGKLVKRYKSTDSQIISIETNDLPSGIYLVKNNHKNYKIIKK